MAQTATAKVLRPAWENAWAALKGWKQWSEPIQTFADTDEDVRRFEVTLRLVDHSAPTKRAPEMQYADGDTP